MPGIFAISVLCAQIVHSTSRKEAAIYGYLFGLGLYLSTTYWISFGMSVYHEQLWWIIPLVFLGIPASMAVFYSLLSIFTWHFKHFILFHSIFCIAWILLEWLMSWLFTGFPWILMGYTFSISTILIQSSSIFGILGLSFIATYIGSTIYSSKMISIRIIVSMIMIIYAVFYGIYRLHKYPTVLSQLKVRIVQPSITQRSKWDPHTFWKNLDQHVTMSNYLGDPDIILWSESAVTVPYYYPPVLSTLGSVFTKQNQILLLGGINDNNMRGNRYKIYSSLIALDNNKKLKFDYHKSRLVPFGEYVPFATYLPIQKITYGKVDYTPGQRSILYLDSLNLYIQPLICYEAIFSEEVRIKNNKTDLIVNITNDGWYGNSSGPYQHFEISKMRAIENGLPMIRAGNNGISAIIDPVGRVLKKLNLNEVTTIDYLIPLKLSLPTIFSTYGQGTVIIFSLFIIVVQQTIIQLYYWFIRL